jgi:hypothetical protein
MRKTTLLACLLVFFISAFSQTDPLYSGFKNPGQDARIRVWWHWMNGNITQDGIRKDLEWMHRTGIGGFQNFDAAFMTPIIVPKRLQYMTPEWKQTFRFMTKLADSLKLEMAIAGSPGWSETGGPWVQPEDAMKKLVWSELRVQGGMSNIKLPAPPQTTGLFQDIPFSEGFSLNGGEQKSHTLFKDVVVVAYRVPDTDIPLTRLNPTITSSAGQFDLGQLTDGILAKTKLLPRDSTTGYAWIQFSFPQPVTIKAVTMVGGGDRGPYGLNGEMADNRSVEASDDGVTFHKVSYIPAGRLVQQTVSVPATTAKYFRVTVQNPPPSAGFGALLGGGGSPPKPPAGTEIAEVVLHTASRVNWSEEQSAFAPDLNVTDRVTPEYGDAIKKRDVIVLTDKMSADGTLNWTAPAGEWNIIRYGYSLIGKENGPASAEATGLEVDKLDPDAIKRYFTTYLEMYKDATGGLMGAKGGLQYMVTDSYEAGAQNWTGNLPAEFKKRRGYDMLPWMPALNGHVVGSAKETDQFLRDFRQTLSDLIVAYHYDGLTEILKGYGMSRYSESHEDGRAMIADGMEVKRTAAIPMSAMWTPGIMGDGLKYQSDIRESAAVAHLYGQNIVAAESLTAMGLGSNAWSYDPAKLKPTADLELAHGLNRFVIHTSVHQPVDDKVPGLGLGIFGQWFNRHDTWAGKARAWSDYLARSSYMLQQGKFVADILYYYGQDNNITGLYRFKLPDLPEGYNYDFINADALVNLPSVKDGKIVTPSGMSYSVLVLDSNARRMSLPVARKIRDLVRAGATITGMKPDIPFGIADDEKEFNAIMNEVWGNSTIGIRSVGQGKVHAGYSVTQALNALRVQPDFLYGNTHDVMYVHRQLPGKEIYWVNNRTANSRTLEADFRVSGRNVEVWHPETGLSETASYAIANGRTKVTLHLTPNDAVFVIFSGSVKSNSYIAPARMEKTVATLEGPWVISFQEDRGAPAGTTLDKLRSWTENSDAGIKYFSGTAVYTKTITVGKADLAKGTGLWLDLGEVKDLAEVIVNGKSAGIVWKTPYRVNIGGLLKAGENKLEVSVTNRWVNRLIGDMQPGAKKITYTTMAFYTARDPLLPAGLLGPVKLVAIK